MILIGQTQICRLKSGTDKTGTTGSSFEQLHICLRSSTHKRRQVENQVRLQFSSTSALIIIPVFGKKSKSDYLCQNK